MQPPPLRFTVRRQRASGGRRVIWMTNPGDMLLIGEVAAIARVSNETVRYWIKTKILPSVRPGKCRLIRREELETFLNRNSSTPPTAPPLLTRGKPKGKPR